MQVRLDGETGPRHRCAAAAPPQEAMSPHRLPSSLSVLTFLLLLVSCERPQLQVKKEAEPLPTEVAITEPAPPDAPADPEPPVAAPVETSATTPVNSADLPAEEPELHVARNGNKIVVSGALKSPIQQKRIVETLTREFPDCEIESSLKLEHHRIAVGWGNRVADEILVPYLTNVKNPRIGYKDTIITIEGSVPSERELRRVTEAVIETFTGGNATDINNKLTVEAEPVKK